MAQRIDNITREKFHGTRLHMN
ncbi:hypothetical protein LINPERPRIM_LOCUS5707 [Linum perenne]